MKHKATTAKAGIEVIGLSRSFGAIQALNALHFNVRPGEILGFLGPNGAGKSTTMRIIAGFLEPSAGMVLVNGHNPRYASVQAKASIGYLPEGAPCYREMTVRRFLSFIAQARGYSGPTIAQRISHTAERLQLLEVIDRVIGELSKGYQRRVGFAQAILHDPPCLIMDEPTDGMDPNQKHAAHALIRTMALDKAVMISTHMLEEAATLCNRIILIDKGTLRFAGTPGEFAARAPNADMAFAFRELTQ